MKKRKLVIVHWIDSCGVSPSWQHLSDVSDYEAVKIKSVGWIVHQDQRSISLCPNISKCDDPQVIGVMTIPKCAVTRIDKL